MVKEIKETYLLGERDLQKRSVHKKRDLQNRPTKKKHIQQKKTIYTYTQNRQTSGQRNKNDRERSEKRCPLEESNRREE